MEKLTSATQVDIGLDPRDPLAIIPPERRGPLRNALTALARSRREAEDRSREIPMP